jgi:hypothetical protein
MSRPPHCLDNRLTDGDKAVSPYVPAAPLPLRKIAPRAIVRLEGNTAYGQPLVDTKDQTSARISSVSLNATETELRHIPQNTPLEIGHDPPISTFLAVSLRCRNLHPRETDIRSQVMLLISADEAK